ncbi:MAG TPA: terminase [Candidatus Avoscillospira avistercoris]|uniref:Terminase n=1 Tax=Candidatus Avoscillospira avistercoris TaxID=2840707 RepID=A0A9D1F9P8_9FIRM|nr:terminase [Candidatus Avoscillospira avistercoris]
MPCSIPPEVLEYIELVESGTPRACPEQHALVAMVRKAFATEDLRVDRQQLDNYLGLQKYFQFRLFPWEKFLMALWDCTYRPDGWPRWKTLFCMVGRGAGKDGLIAFDSACSISPYNPVGHYNVDICANNEDQATQPCRDLVEVLETPKHEAKLKKHFYHTKELIQGRKNKGVMKGRTNNPKGRDGMRSGKIIFNEVHAYENYDNIKVFVTGLGKVDQPRIGYFTSNGDVSDGPLDDKLAQARRILFEGEDDGGMLPFICCLENRDQVHDPDNWYMANPSLSYRPALLQETADEYKDWLEHPEQNGDFLTKRMGLRAGQKEISVTDYEQVKATNRPLPDLSGWSCIVGLDYAELSDWAAVNLHFRQGVQRFDINHAWICTQSKTLPRVKAPWRAWAEAGHCTVVDDVSISPDLLADYIRQAAMVYNVKLLAMDHYRWTLVSESMRKIGFDANDKNRVKLVRPSDIMQVEPVIQECFDRGLFTWDDNPCLRWSVNNTKRIRSSKKLGVDTGNFIYAKIEAKSRKTDPWMALVASMVGEPVLGTGQAVGPPPMGAVKL